MMNPLFLNFLRRKNPIQPNIADANIANAGRALGTTTGFNKYNGIETLTPNSSEKQWNGLNTLKISTPGTYGYEGTIISEITVTPDIEHTIIAHINAPTGHDVVMKDEISGAGNDALLVADDTFRKRKITYTPSTSTLKLCILTYGTSPQSIDIYLGSVIVREGAY